MFVFGHDSWAMTIAAIIAAWVIIGFFAGALYIIAAEIGYRNRRRHERRASKEYFLKIEELQNDFD